MNRSTGETAMILLGPHSPQGPAQMLSISWCHIPGKPHRVRATPWPPPSIDLFWKVKACRKEQISWKGRGGAPQQSQGRWRQRRQAQWCSKAWVLRSPGQDTAPIPVKQDRTGFSEHKPHCYFTLRSKTALYKLSSKQHLRLLAVVDGHCAAWRSHVSELLCPSTHLKTITEEILSHSQLQTLF